MKTSWPKLDCSHVWSYVGTNVKTKQNRFRCINCKNISDVTRGGRVDRRRRGYA